MFSGPHTEIFIHTDTYTRRYKRTLFDSLKSNLYSQSCYFYLQWDQFLGGKVVVSNSGQGRTWDGSEDPDWSEHKGPGPVLKGKPG